MDTTLFPISEYWWFYAVFAGFVMLLLALDLGVFHRQSHAVSFKEATLWSLIWVSLALSFNFVLYRYALWKFPQDPRLLALPGFDPSAAASQVSLEFLTGYIIEKSLSVDNIFIFVVIFSYFAVPAIYQHRVLFYGIIGAFIFRAIFIAMGSVLMQYHWVILVFGAFLIITGVKMMFTSEKKVDPEKNVLIRLFKRFVPVTPQMHGHAAPDGAVVFRDDRRDFCARFGARHLRCHERADAGFHLEYLCHTRAAGDVLSARRSRR
jgi:tellurite resistance protein TerC